MGSLQALHVIFCKREHTHASHALTALGEVEVCRVQPRGRATMLAEERRETLQQLKMSLAFILKIASCMDAVLSPISASNSHLIRAYPRHGGWNLTALSMHTA